jgi:hypothetical protein
MNPCSRDRRACKKFVEVTIKQVAATVVTPTLGLGVGTALPARRGNRLRNGLWGAAVGLGVGAVAQAITPPVQKLVCGDCGCDQLAA